MQSRWLVGQIKMQRARMPNEAHIAWVDCREVLSIAQRPGRTKGRISLFDFSHFEHRDGSLNTFQI